MLKIGESSNFEDGDILGAFNRRRIGIVYADHIGDVGNAGGGKLVHRIYDSIPRRLRNAIYQYEFRRVSTNFVKRINLLTDEEEIIGKTPNAKGETMNVPVFLKMRLNHERHAIFGSPGEEVWYGGKTNTDETSVNNLWSIIEEHSSHRRKDYELWPVGNLDCRHHLQIKVDNI